MDENTKIAKPRIECQRGFTVEMKDTLFEEEQEVKNLTWWVLLPMAVNKRQHLQWHLIDHSQIACESMSVHLPWLHVVCLIECHFK
jgi:hypothetical protein